MNPPFPVDVAPGWPSSISRLGCLALVTWTLLVGASLAWNLRVVQRQTMDMAYAQSRAGLDKDLTPRRWATDRGGVYAPVGTDQQPTARVDDLPQREQIAESTRNLGLTHGALWLLGLAAIFFFSRAAQRRRAQLRREAAERASAEKRFRTLFEQSRDGILILDPDTLACSSFNAVAHEQLGYAREEFARLRLTEIAEQPRELSRQIDLVRERGWASFETRQRHRDGTLRDVQVVAQRLVVDECPALHCTLRDISDRKKAERDLHLYANIFRHSGEGILVTDRDNRIVAVNPAFTRLTGYELDDIRGENPRVLGSSRTPRATYQRMWNSLREHDFWQGEIWDRRRDGGLYPKWAAISVIRDAAGAVEHYIASFTDVSERKAAEERIDYLAHHDPLTGLPNRFNLESRLGQALLMAQRDRQQVQLMSIDLDRFKVINDTLGHLVGDQLLIEVARRLEKLVRKSDIVARLGGDEFVVVLVGVAPGGDTVPVASQILHVLGEPYAIGGRVLHSTPSIGISLYPDDGADGAVLMGSADTAMYFAKEQGRNNIQFFTPAMNTAASERLSIENDLRAALRERQFVLHYQPLVRTANGETCAVEALVRWMHPQLGMMPPDRFIPVAEEAGLIEELGAWVLDESCRQLAAWRADGLGGLRMSVNLSARQLRSPALIDAVRGALERHGLRGDDLELEITETVAMDDPDAAIGRMLSLRELGVQLAIDDFGTGYSSLAYLKLLPIQRIKLDRSFVRDIETDENDAAISAATLALAHSLGLTVVAEGVETEGQRDFLARHGCDVLQGFLLGRPQPAIALSERWKAPHAAAIAPLSANAS